MLGIVLSEKSNATQYAQKVALHFHFQPNCHHKTHYLREIMFENPSLCGLALRKIATNFTTFLIITVNIGSTWRNLP